MEELRHTSQEKLVAMLKAAIHEHEGEPPPAPPAPHQAPSLLLPPTASLGTENAGSTPGQQPVDMEIDQGGSDVVSREIGSARGGAAHKGVALAACAPVPPSAFAGMHPASLATLACRALQDADSASEFLGVRRRQACSFSSGGDAALRWEAALQLQLDAAGVPASGAAPRSVVVATTTELGALEANAPL